MPTAHVGAWAPAKGSSPCWCGPRAPSLCSSELCRAEQSPPGALLTYLWAGPSLEPSAAPSWVPIASAQNSNSLQPPALDWPGWSQQTPEHVNQWIALQGPKGPLCDPAPVCPGLTTSLSVPGAQSWKLSQLQAGRDLVRAGRRCPHHLSQLFRRRAPPADV